MDLNYNYDLIAQFRNLNLFPVYTFSSKKNIFSLIHLVQESISKKFDGFSELKQLINTSFKPNEFLDCYLQILNSLKIETGKMNEVSLEVLNQILFIENLISLIETLIGKDMFKERQNIFQNLEYFPIHDKALYKKVILEIEDFLGALQKLEILEKSLIQHITDQNVQNFQNDLAKISLIGTEKMLFGCYGLDFRCIQLIQGLCHKIHESAENFKTLQNEISENTSDLKTKCLYIKKIAEQEHLVKHEFDLIGHFFYESIRLHKVFEHVANKLYENNTYRLY